MPSEQGGANSNASPTTPSTPSAPMLPPLSNLDSTFESQFSETLRYCKEQIPYYRDRWRNIDPELQFAEVTPINKAELRTRHSAFLNRTLAARHLLHTSGTTGDPLLVPRSSEEVSFVNQVFEGLRNTRPAPSLRRLGLSIRDNVHGFGPAYKTDTLWVGDPSFTPPTLELALQYLIRDFDLPECERRITSLFMSLLEVLHFSEFAAQRGMDASHTQIDTIYSTGFPTCPTWNDAIASRWKCRHINVFSLTEVFGQALRCDRCGLYHWDPFSAVEFLTPDDIAAVEQGVARLVITTLYPYTQLMPLVRYDTDDLVFVERSCPSGPGFVPLGRRAAAARLPDGTVLPFDSVILEALSSCTWIDRVKPFSLEKLGIVGTETFGMPRVGIRQEGGASITITLAPSRARKQPTPGEIRTTASLVEDACIQSIARFARPQQGLRIAVEVGPIGDRSRPMFGCATAGRPGS